MKSRKFIVSLSRDDQFTSIRIKDPARYAPRFLITTESLRTLFNGDPGERILDEDLNNFISVRRCRSYMLFRISWIEDIAYNGDIVGWRNEFDIPDAKFAGFLMGEDLQILIDPDEPMGKSKIIFESGTLKKFICEKQKRRALSKFFKTHFNYGRDTVVYVHPDVGNMMIFNTDNLFGGIVEHQRLRLGKDGKTYTEIYYSIHT